MSEEQFPGFTELISAGGRTGVIVGMSAAVTHEQAAHVLDMLAERFPGVTFAVVDQCAALISFSFDPPEEAP